MFEAGFFSPDPIANGHGDVAFDSAPCGDDEGSIDWGDDTITSDFQLKHTYAYNGSFKVHIRCEPTGAFFSEKYVTRANVNTAQPPPPSYLGLTLGALSGIAALITAVVGALAFLAGRKTK